MINTQASSTNLTLNFSQTKAPQEKGLFMVGNFAIRVASAVLAPRPAY
jgi:hypothetical protein